MVQEEIGILRSVMDTCRAQRLIGGIGGLLLIVLVACQVPHDHRGFCTYIRTLTTSWLRAREDC